MADESITDKSGQEYMLYKLNESYDFIRIMTSSIPEIGIILGTGLGCLVNDIEIGTRIPYSDIPNFPLSTVESHEGELIFGRISGKEIVAMHGRFHYYEGYSMKEVTFPVRIMKMFGIKTLLISNASGSMNTYIKKGDLMIIEDHINLMGDNPLLGISDPKLGTRFPDMSQPWSHRLIELVENIAIDLKIKIHKGVYIAVTGPNLETRAEYRFLRNTGADVVGMSTVPENIVARQLGIEVLGLSVITDECYPDALVPVTLEEILEAAAKAEPNLKKIIKGLISKL
jgi:purine-nucleoside phosphorylase